MQTIEPTVPNHHAQHPGFSGLTGLLAAVTFLVGRTSDADLAARLVELTGDDRLVDIGCGPGVAARRAAARGATVIGVDPAPVMLRVARLRSPGTVAWRKGTAESLPLPDGDVTVAWSLATVHHWADVTGGLREVRRVLRPGGRFLAIERRVAPGATGHASHGWTESQADAFTGACVDAGFETAVVSRHRTRRGPVLAVLAPGPAAAAAV